jgi:nucleotidyltransferase substrate binding protein (TIGR01987 family)
MSQKILVLGDIDISSLLLARAALGRSLAAEKNEFTRNSSIQCFEFTLELFWKTLKRVLDKMGVTVTSPRDTFRLAAREHLVADPKVWFAYIELRNLSSHTYKDAVAEKIYKELAAFAQAIDTSLETLRALK